jgi:hypothetical protein
MFCFCLTIFLSHYNFHRDTQTVTQSLPSIKIWGEKAKKKLLLLLRHLLGASTNLYPIVGCAGQKSQFRNLAKGPDKWSDCCVQK